MYYQKTFKLFFPLVITTLAGIGGTLLLETWGYSQLFLLYSVIPFIGVLLASSAFYQDSEIKSEKMLLPIPQREIDNNTQIVIPQNPGY
jgi:hypothetical protein